MARVVVDHVVILSGPLEREIARFGRLGFVVERGGAHPRWGTENALLVLGDGTYLEFLAVRAGAQSTHRLWRRPDGTLRSPGTFGAVALAVSDLARTVARLRAAGIPFGDPEPGGRLRPDGREVAWRLAFSAQPDLPFLIEDVTPRSLRVPPPPRGSLNAACALSGITVTSRMRGRAVRAYAALVDRPLERSPGHADRVPVGAVTIAVCDPDGPESDGGVEGITLAIPPSAAAALPLIRSAHGTAVAPEATGGLRIRVPIR